MFFKHLTSPRGSPIADTTCHDSEPATPQLRRLPTQGPTAKPAPSIRMGTSDLSSTLRFPFDRDLNFKTDLPEPIKNRKYAVAAANLNWAVEPRAKFPQLCIKKRFKISN